MIRVLNNTHYFNPYRDRLYNLVPDTSSFQSLSIKQLGYYIRMYYEFLDCQRQHGQTVFLTFTYNDAALRLRSPFGIPCVCNDDIIYLHRDSKLRRKLKSYGITFKYFVASEFGEGKGIRGKGQNPHFHAIYYLYGINRPINSTDVDLFIRTVRYYWQGDERPASKIVDPRFFKFGKVDISRAGKTVNDFKAFKYTSKYTCKDMESKNIIKSLCKAFYNDILEEFFNYDFDHNYKLVEVYFKRNNQHNLPLISAKELYTTNIDFANYLSRFVENKYQRTLSSFRSTYFPRVFMSHGLGSYGFTQLTKDYQLKVPTSNGFKYFNLPSYYVRKLFYDVVKDEKGNNKYVLNSTGYDFKLNNLENRINDLSERAKSIATLKSFEHLPSQDSCNCNYDFFTLYSIYKIIYEYRFYDIRLDSSIDPYNDFSFFIQPSYYDTDYLESYSYKIIGSFYSKYMRLYKFHPCFKDLVVDFDRLDKVISDYEYSEDDVKYKEYLDKKHVKNFHKQ